MKLALRFSGAFVLGMCLVWGVSSYLRVQREIALFEGDISTDHEIRGRDLASAMNRIWELAGRDAAERFLESANLAESELMIRWLPADAPSELLLQAGLSRDRIEELVHGSRVIRAHLKRAGDSRLHTWIPVALADGTRGVIEVAESMAERNRYIRITILRTLVTTAVVILVSAGIAVVLGLIFVGRPVRSLIEHARRVAAGDLSGRVQLHQSDELSELAAEMNAMSARLADAYLRIDEEKTARQSTLEQLRHADRLMTAGKLASAVAHELGTPLNVIMARAKMIAAGEVNGTGVSESARTIVGQAKHMTVIIRQLLDLATRRKPQRTRIDLRHIARQTQALLSPIAGPRRVAIEISGPEIPLPVHVDPEQIQQVISNLAINGMEAMPQGGRLALTWSPCEIGDPASAGGRRYVRLDVVDGGVGITADNLKKLFTPFFTTKGLAGGTGLGLSISADIAREHGGWIDVESRPGQGSRFSIFLPAEDEACVGAS